MQLHHTFPAYPLKVEFTPGTWGENDWKLGEIACVSRAFYAFPDGTEYAVFKFCERTHTGRKRLRWEAWHNGKFSNNYFNGFDEAVSWAENLVRFNAWPGKLNDYRVYPQ